LENGDWTTARLLFDRFVQLYPLDERVPDALYRSARLAYLQGDYPTCALRLDTLLTDYPIPELWDRAWRLRAELQFRTDQRGKGLESLREIHGIDETVDMESVALKTASVLTEIASETGAPSDIEAAEESWNKLIRDWPESPLVAEYRNSLDQLRADAIESSGEVSR
jgi:outer membrane protein assembly factor BamD (BamD/ComL family)